MFAIRDDDTSYWTSVKDISTVYEYYMNKGYKISLAVVPCAYETFHKLDRKLLYQGTEKKNIYENKELVDYLKSLIKENRIEIMQHGYDHSYCIEMDGKNMFLDKKLREQIGASSDYKFIPECVHKDKGRLKKEIIKGKKILENTFETNVSVFVPPSNALTLDSSTVISEIGMNISGTMTSNFNRRKNIYGFKNYIQKVLWKLNNKDNAYPFVQDYGIHKELIGYAFTPKTDMNKFRNQFMLCKKYNCDFVLATHYWELKENMKLYNDLHEFCNNMNVDREKKIYVSDTFK